MPIHGVTDAAPRFTRAGHIRLGIKKQSARGGEYPEKSDHFIADFESAESTKLFHEIYGAQPKMITVAFAHQTPDEIFPQWYKCYGSSSGLKCKGDGCTAWRSTPEGDMSEVDCPTPSECDYGKANGCKQMASLQFFIRGLPGFQIYQCNTTSWNSIRNINSGLQMLQVVRGDKPIRGVWVDLYLVPQEAQHDGKRVNIYVLKLDIRANLDNLKALECALDYETAALPAPDEKRDEYLTPTQPVPAPMPAPAPEPPAPAPQPGVSPAVQAYLDTCDLYQIPKAAACKALLSRHGKSRMSELTDEQVNAGRDELRPVPEFGADPELPGVGKPWGTW